MSVAKDSWLEYLQERACVERFTPEPVSEEILEQILESGRCTSPPWNRQSWKFIVVASDAGRVQALEHCHGPGPAAHAPVLLAGLADPAKETEVTVPAAGAVKVILETGSGEI